MNLAIDLGNTSSAIFLFKEDNLVLEKHFSGPPIKALETLFKRYPIQWSILSSVIKNDTAVRAFLRRQSTLIELSATTPLPVKNQYSTPKTLGNDRIACVCGAAQLFPKKNVLVIDAGTCIKYDFINSKKEYKGGSISPGLNMRFKSLHHYTEKLPLIVPAEIASFTGKSTKESILTGVQQGIINEMNGFIALYKKKYPSLKVIMTGGDAARFAHKLNFPIFAAPALIAIGLNEILRYNQSPA